ncbi:hypothetical protein ACLX1H_011260 [Fusarium chlamydosporum]
MSTSLIIEYLSSDGSLTTYYTPFFNSAGLSMSTSTPILYFDLITSQSKYEKHNKPSQLLVDLDLNPSSAWDRKHLFACHVICSSNLANNLPALRKVSAQPLDGSTATHRYQIEKFIEGPDVSQRAQTETHLVHTVGVSLGQIWGSLDAIRTRTLTESAGGAADPASSPVTPRPKRRKSNTSREGFVDSGQMKVASSSPIGAASPSPAKSTGYADPSAIHDLPHEAYAVLLSSCVLRHLLYYSHTPDAQHTVEFRLQQRMTAELNKTKSIAAEDDGGLCVRVSKSKLITMDSIELFEAKRRLHVVNDVPVISDGVLAQMTCEAIAARMSRKGDEAGDYVFIINGTQQYMRFFQFSIKKEYIESIKKGQMQGRELNVAATRWFNLNDRLDRKCVVENIFQL